MDEIDAFLAAKEDAERGPNEQDLLDAPTLNPWRIHQNHGSNVLYLYGRVQNHPTIKDEFLTTSPLLGFDHAAGWARTRSRWYRIGPDWEDVKSTDRDDTADVINGVIKLISKRAVAYYEAEIQHR
jgi:hypothetical protein